MGSHFFERLFGGRSGGHGGGHHGRGRHGSHGEAWGREQSAPQATQRVLVCPKCRTDNSSDSRFCANCGQQFGGADAACAKCSATIAPNSKFCSSCGTAVGG